MCVQNDTHVLTAQCVRSKYEMTHVSPKSGLVILVGRPPVGSTIPPALHQGVNLSLRHVNPTFGVDVGCLCAGPVVDATACRKGHEGFLQVGCTVSHCSTCFVKMIPM